jgi:hypothetical protein
VSHKIIGRHIETKDLLFDVDGRAGILSHKRRRPRVLRGDVKGANQWREIKPTRTKDLGVRLLRQGLKEKSFSKERKAAIRVYLREGSIAGGHASWEARRDREKASALHLLVPPDRGQILKTNAHCRVTLAAYLTISFAKTIKKTPYDNEVLKS